MVNDQNIDYSYFTPLHRNTQHSSRDARSPIFISSQIRHASTAPQTQRGDVAPKVSQILDVIALVTQCNLIFLFQQ